MLWISCTHCHDKCIAYKILATFFGERSHSVKNIGGTTGYYNFTDDVVEDLPEPQPNILFQVKIPKQLYIASNKEVICCVEAKEAAAALIATFYICHLEYTTGCHNFYRLLESAFFNRSPP